MSESKVELINVTLFYMETDLFAKNQNSDSVDRLSTYFVSSWIFLILSYLFRGFYLKHLTLHKTLFLLKCVLFEWMLPNQTDAGMLDREADRISNVLNITETRRWENIWRRCRRWKEFPKTSSAQAETERRSSVTGPSSFHPLKGRVYEC